MVCRRASLNTQCVKPISGLATATEDLSQKKESNEYLIKCSQSVCIPTISTCAFKCTHTVHACMHTQADGICASTHKQNIHFSVHACPEYMHRQGNGIRYLFFFYSPPSINVALVSSLCCSAALYLVKVLRGGVCTPAAAAAAAGTEAEGGGDSAPALQVSSSPSSIKPGKRVSVGAGFSFLSAPRHPILLLILPWFVD